MFLRKNKNKLQVYKNNDIEFNFQIIYKKIKHIYFRFKDDVLVITANHNLSEKQIIDSIDLNLDKILKLKVKKVRIDSKKYQLWGKEISESDFFQDLDVTEKNMHKIYIDKTYKMIHQLQDRLVNDLSKLGLSLVETKVKPLKTKYGSCQIVKKVITINSFLAKLDQEYLYYVLLHEYAHLLVPNHQRQFYEKLDIVMKNHKQIQKNLRKHTIMF